MKILADPCFVQCKKRVEKAELKILILSDLKEEKMAEDHSIEEEMVTECQFDWKILDYDISKTYSSSFLLGKKRV